MPKNFNLTKRLTAYGDNLTVGLLGSLPQQKRRQTLKLKLKMNMNISFR